MTMVKLVLNLLCGVEGGGTCCDGDGDGVAAFVTGGVGGALDGECGGGGVRGDEAAD